MNLRAFVAGESDESNFPLSPGLFERLDHSALCEMQLRIVVVNNFVNLPQVKVIGLQTPQRIFELAHRFMTITPVSANLGHQKDLVAPVPDSLAHQLFAASVVILPGVVQKSDPSVN